MFKDFVGVDTFRSFVDSFSEETLLIRSGSADVSSTLWLFNLSGFVLFFAFLVVCRSVVGEQEIATTLDQSAYMAITYLVLIGIVGIVVFILRTVGLGLRASTAAANKITVCVLLSLVVLSIDYFVDGSFFGVLDRSVLSLFADGVDAPDWITNSIVASIIALFGVLILAVNTARRSWQAIRKKRRIARRIALGAILGAALNLAVGGQIIRVMLWTNPIVDDAPAADQAE